MPLGIGHVDYVVRTEGQQLAVLQFHTCAPHRIDYDVAWGVGQHLRGVDYQNEAVCVVEPLPSLLPRAC